MTVNVSQDPVQTARSKLAELQVDNDRDKADLEAVYAASTDKSNGMQAAVDAMLSGRNLAATARLSASELRERIRIRTAAIEAQKKIIAELEHVAGVEIAKQLQPEHEALVGELAKAVAGLREVAERYFAFCNKLNDTGAKWSSVFELCPFVGQITRDAPTWLYSAWLDRVKAAYPRLVKGL